MSEIYEFRNIFNDRKAYLIAIVLFKYCSDFFNFNGPSSKIVTVLDLDTCTNVLRRRVWLHCNKSINAKQIELNLTEFADFGSNLTTYNIL